MAVAVVCAGPMFRSEECSKIMSELVKRRHRKAKRKKRST
jgi:hypothetical protein